MFILDVDYCSELNVVINLLKSVINLIKWGIPIVLILYGIIDLGKAVMAGKEDEMKKAQGTLIKRCVYAVAVFLVVTIVMFVMNVIADAGAETGSQDWWSCWNKSGGSSDNGVEK